MPFTVQDSNDSTGFLLWQVTAVWQRKITGVLRVHELTQVQFALLASLLWLSKTENHITQVMLAQHAKLDVMMTSQVLRHLEKSGLLERRMHPTDTRAKVLSLTKIGRKKIRAAIPDVEKADELFFNKLKLKREQFNTALITLIS